MEGEPCQAYWRTKRKVAGHQAHSQEKIKGELQDSRAVPSARPSHQLRPPLAMSPLPKESHVALAHFSAILCQEEEVPRESS